MSESPSKKDTNDELSRVDAVSLAKLIRDKELSPVEAVSMTIERIERLDKDLNSVIHRQFERALKLAASPELPDGPFKGVPMLIKDLWAEENGEPHHAGVKGMRDAEYIAKADSDLVTRYKEAGFIIVGRTNTPEMGAVATTEPLSYGPTKNPWNFDYGPGGSSGGSAAAVAAGFLPAANASDGGGSIRIPAAMCGLVGLKPSRGRVPMGPDKEEWGVSIQHVVSHTVRDTSAILDATARNFPGDGVFAPEFGRPYFNENFQNLNPLKIGIKVSDPRVEVNPDCIQAVHNAASLLSDLGHHVEETSPEALNDVEKVSELGWAFGTNWSVNIAANFAYLSKRLGRELVEDDVEPGTWFLAQRGKEQSALNFVKAQGIMANLRRELANWWSSGFDLLLTPTTAQPPPLIGRLAPTEDDPIRASIESVPYSVFTSPFNTTGQPAISLPIGSSNGLPVGIQLVGAYGREDIILAVSSQLEEVVNWSENRAPFHA